MPPSLRRRLIRWPAMRGAWLALAPLAAAAAIVGPGFACADASRDADLRAAARQYPPPPQTPIVVALGNLPIGRPPSRAEVQLSEFLFGAAPESSPGLVRPIDVAADGDNLLICDVALATVFDRRAPHGELRDLPLDPRPRLAVAAALTPEGDRLVVDAPAGCVRRYDRAGRLRATYRIDAPPMRPAGAIAVDAELWVTNLAAHRVEVFDLLSAAHVRSFGGRGRGPGQFAIPLGIARAPTGEVCVVDMLNCRVQVFDPAGRYLRTIGGPGDRVGQFGRPKDVAVGPDGTVFVTDAASQRVHAFAADGRPLLTFGDATGGPGALELPGGLTVAVTAPLADLDLPAGFAPDYFVLVAEQTRLPGIRLYAWRSPPASVDAVQEPSPRPNSSDPASGQPGPPEVNHAGTINPHWRPQRCLTCHEDGPAPISPVSADRLCLTCHDGRHATAEAHPVGRLATGPRLRLPDGWPLSDGRLSCLTCHAIDRHCREPVRRPAVNPAMVRDYDPARPQEFCNLCHVVEQPWRLNPHRNLDDRGQVESRSCLFCHNNVPPVPPDGRRAGNPNLRVASSQLCLSCHTRHWDYSPRGHVERPATSAILANLDRAAARAQLAALPLNGSAVACYSCHNPHQRGLFAPGSPLDGRGHATGPPYAALRLDPLELCTTCHAK